MPYSPSYLAACNGGCPARAADYRERHERIPSDPMREGSMFHRIVEAIGRGMPVEDAITDSACSSRVADLVRVWAVDWDERPCLGRELAIAIGEDGAVSEWGAAWVRGIVDHMEAGDDGQIIVTDWKSGWSGWTGVQAEVYALLGAALATSAGLPFDRVVCRVWSPVAGGFRGVHEWPADALPWDVVRAEVEAARRLELRPADEERIGEGCKWCQRSEVCASFARLEVPPPVSVEDEARLYLAMRERLKLAEARLRAHCEETGERVLGLGFGATENRVMDGAAVLGGLLAPWGVGGDAVLALLKVIDVSATTAKAVARKVRPRDTAGQGVLLDSWTTRVDMVPRWGIGGGDDEG